MNKNMKLFLIVAGIILIFYFANNLSIYQLWNVENDIELGTTNYDRCLADANYFQSQYSGDVVEWRCWNCPLKNYDTTHTECRLGCNEQCPNGANCMYPGDCDTGGCGPPSTSYCNGAPCRICHATDRSYWEPSVQGCVQWGGPVEAYVEIVIETTDTPAQIADVDARYQLECNGVTPTQPPQPICPTNQYYDINTKKCEVNPCITPTTPPTGYYWDSTQCKFRYICNQDTQVYDATSQSCKPKGQPTTPGGIINWILGLIAAIIQWILGWFNAATP